MKVKHLFLIVTSFLCISSVATAGILDPCESTAWVIYSGDSTFSICPAGDFQTLGGQGMTIRICAFDGNGDPIPGMPPSDFFLVECDPVDCLFLCAFSANADSATNLNGYTTITGSIRGGGCVTGLSVVAQGNTIKEANCVDDLCLPITVHTLDITGTACPEVGGLLITGNGTVDLSDFSFFGPCNGNSGFVGGFNCDCLNYVPPAVVDLSDFSFFGSHLGHSCP